MNIIAEETAIRTGSFQDQPTHFLSTQVNGKSLKPITRVLWDRRTKPHFDQTKSAASTRRFGWTLGVAEENIEEQPKRAHGR
jgi:secreted PhoX family phosphatase